MPVRMFHTRASRSLLAVASLVPFGLKAIAVTIVIAVVGTAIIGAIVRGLIGLRIAPEIERQGLDINQHGEEGYMTS